MIKYLSHIILLLYCSNVLQAQKAHKAIFVIAQGISHTGRLSAVDTKVFAKNKKLTVSWQVMDKKGMAKIWLATDNLFKQGKEDNYQLVKTVPVENGNVMISVKDMPSKF
jgi:hypothetical protein